MTQVFKNNAYASLAAELSAVGTLASLATGQGVRFPAPTGGDHFLATLILLDGNGAETAWEIVKCTARATDGLTIDRAQEGTTARIWPAGTRIELRTTAGTLDSFTDTAQAAAAAPVQSVAGRTGAVTLAKADVGLGNVDNTSDANKPVSTAQQTALNGKQDALVSGTSIKTVNSTSLLGAGNVVVGDVMGQALSVDSELALFSGTGGKTIKRATGSGLVKLTSGVLATAAAGTDYLAPSAVGVTVQGYSATLASWSGKTPPSGTVAGTSDAQTLTNKTFTGYTETVYSLTGTAIDPANGTIQYKTLAANTTFTENLADGQSVILMLNPATYSITWPAVTWVGSTASTAPTLAASVYNYIVLFQIAGTLYGKYEGRV